MDLAARARERFVTILRLLNTLSYYAWRLRVLQAALRDAPPPNATYGARAQWYQTVRQAALRGGIREGEPPRCRRCDDRVGYLVVGLRQSEDGTWPRMCDACYILAYGESAMIGWVGFLEQLPERKDEQ